MIRPGCVSKCLQRTAEIIDVCVYFKQKHPRIIWIDKGCEKKDY